MFIRLLSEQLKEKKFDLTEEELHLDFALPNVLQSLFGLVEHIFNMQITDREVEVWHPDVLCFFHVYDGDSDDKHIASFYWIHAPNLKISKEVSGWMCICVGKSKALIVEDPSSCILYVGMQQITTH